MTDDRSIQPLFTAPPQSCDAHFHVFGPADRYPHGGVDEKLRYAPPLAPLEDYLVQARKLGFVRFVFVQPSAYGRDNRYMLDAMSCLPGSRGIVDVDQDAPDGMLAALDAAGFRGVRINVSPVKPPQAGFAADLLPRIARLDARCAAFVPRFRSHTWACSSRATARAKWGLGNFSICCVMARGGPG